MSSADTETPEEEAEVDEAREAIAADFARLLGDDLLETHIGVGKDLVIRVAGSAWKKTMQVARHELHFGYFEFLSAIDWMPSPYGRYEDTAVDDDDSEPVDLTPVQGLAGGETRMQVFARLMDLTGRKIGLTIKADVDDENPSVETIIAVYPGANWHERECAEMFGIDFVGHPYLEHLYLPGGFEGHPMRKDYPLVARMVKPWPGIVDVEPMPGPSSDEGDAE